jgi:hypothetical protein
MPMPVSRRLQATLSPALTAAGLLLGVALLAAAVRVLPWVLDPQVPARAVLPFARSLLGIAAEAALLVGWPVGWGLSLSRRVESGEARVFALLGEPPWRTALRLAPEALLLAALLFAVSVAGGRDAEAPGRVVDALLDEGRTSCAQASGPATYAVPLADATWLCDPPQPPRLVAFAPGALGRLPFTALSAHLSGDLRALDLDDVHVGFGDPAKAAAFAVHAGHVHLGGLPSWARASSLPALLRGLLVACAALAAAFISVERLLQVRASSSGLRLPLVLALGASGPVAALATMRALEAHAAPAPWFSLVPVAAAGAVLLVAVVFSRVSRRLARLRSRRLTATT